MSGIGLRREDYGTHSLRRTRASFVDTQTGTLRAVQILLGHTKIESTARYLGLDVDDALMLAEGKDVRSTQLLGPRVEEPSTGQPRFARDVELP